MIFGEYNPDILIFNVSAYVYCCHSGWDFSSGFWMGNAKGTAPNAAVLAGLDLSRIFINV